MNLIQFTKEILKKTLLPFKQRLYGNLEDYKTNEDGYTAHTSPLAAE